MLIKAYSVRLASFSLSSILIIFSLLSERRISRWVVSVDNVIVFSLSSNEKDFLEYDLGLFSRTAWICLMYSYAVLFCMSFNYVCHNLQFIFTFQE